MLLLTYQFRPAVLEPVCRLPATPSAVPTRSLRSIVETYGRRFFPLRPQPPLVSENGSHAASRRYMPHSRRVTRAALAGSAHSSLARSRPRIAGSAHRSARDRSRNIAIDVVPVVFALEIQRSVVTRRLDAVHLHARGVGDRVGRDQRGRIDAQFRTVGQRHRLRVGSRDSAVA